MKKAVLVVGMTIIVVPIFSSAVAQTQQTQTLLEIQVMREEIGQLRDLVERQGQTIRLLERRIEQGQQPSVSASSQYGRPTTGFQTQGEFYENTAPAQAGQSGQVPLTQPTHNNFPTNQQGFPAPQNSQLANRPSNTTAAVDQIPRDAYQPFDSNAAQGTGQQAPTVEDRVINAPPIPAQQGGFPPVVDRSIGRAPTLNQDPNGIPSQPQLEQAVPPAFQEPVTDQGISARPLEPFNSGSATRLPNQAPNAGVIAVPSAPSSAQGIPSAGNQQASLAGQTSEDEMYNQGFELLKQSKFEDAASVFEKQINVYPQGNLADDAHYWISEAMTMVSNTEAARVNLKAIVDDYPQSSRVPDARLRLAYIEERKGNLIEARILLQEVVNKHPQSDAAIAARNRLETLQ